MNARPPSRPRTPQETFTRVAQRYDLWNACLSLGLDQRWRRTAARALDVHAGGRILDVATGTGGLARAVADVTSHDVHIVGCDCNAEMLRVAAEQVPARHRGRIELIRASVESLPFSDGTFDAATIGFAIDDFADREAALREIRRVLRPGRPLVVLELSLPEQPLVSGLYQLYLRAFRGGWAHLREEITLYRGRDAVPRLLQATGFSAVQSRAMTGGLVMLHLARRQG